LNLPRSRVARSRAVDSTLAALLKKTWIQRKGSGRVRCCVGARIVYRLRVGLSAIKGLAETLHKAIATVSVLERWHRWPTAMERLPPRWTLEERKFFRSV